MILGTPVEATLWEVTYRHLRDPSKREQPEPRATVHNGLSGLSPAQAFAVELAREEAAPYITGRIFVLTADPSGEDLVPVARRSVLGVAAAPLDFSLMAVQRVADRVTGLAALAGVVRLTEGQA